jgi:prepilin-type N-terminal cleavage/methylation domain-containing protein
MSSRCRGTVNVDSAFTRAHGDWTCHSRSARVRTKARQIPLVTIRPCDRSPSTQHAAFTLIEVLMVLVIIGSFAVLVFGGLRGASNAAALRSAQATVGGLITVARTHAVSSGKPTRIIINIDPITTSSASRFLRYIAVQTQGATGWLTITQVALPGDVFVVPGDFATLPTGLFASDPGGWVHVDGSTLLRSSALRSAQISTEPVDSDTAQRWVSIAFSGTGTTAQSGDLILAEGRNRAPGSFILGQAPVELINRDHVCGLTLSAYGVAALIGDRASF